MLQLSQIQSAIADNIFNGDTTVAGLVMVFFVMGLVFAMSRNIFHSLIMGLPLILVFSALGIISGDMTIILIVIIVLGLAVVARHSVDGGNGS